MLALFTVAVAASYATTPVQLLASADCDEDEGGDDDDGGDNADSMPSAIPA